MAYCQHPNHLLSITVNLIEALLTITDDPRLVHYRDQAKTVMQLTAVPTTVTIPASIKSKDQHLYSYKVYKNNYINKKVSQITKTIKMGGAIKELVLKAGQSAFSFAVNMIYYTIITLYYLPSISYKTIVTAVSGHAQTYIMNELVAQKKILPMGDLILYTLVTGLTESDKLDLFYSDNKKRQVAYQDVVMNSPKLKRDSQTAEMAHNVFKFLAYLVMYTTSTRGEALQKRMQRFASAMYGSTSGKRIESIISMGDIFDIKAELDRQNNKLCKVSQEPADLDTARQFFGTVLGTFEELEQQNLIDITNKYYITTKKVVETATRLFAAKFNENKPVAKPASKITVTSNATLYDVLVNEASVTPLGDEVLYAIVTGITNDDSLKLFYSQHEQRKADYSRVLTKSKQLPVDLTIAVGLLVSDADMHTHCQHDLEKTLLALFGDKRPSIPLSIMSLYRLIRSGREQQRNPSDFRAIYYRILTVAESLKTEFDTSNPLLSQTFIALETAFSQFEKKHGVRSLFTKPPQQQPQQQKQKVIIK